MERRSDKAESMEIRPIAQRDVATTEHHEEKSMGEKMKDSLKSLIPNALKKDGDSEESGKDKGTDTRTYTIIKDTGVSKITSTVTETPGSVSTTVTEHIEKFHN